MRALESALGIVPLTLPVPPSTPAQFVAFANTNSGAVNAAPQIANVYFTRGTAVSPTGTFRIADIDPAKTVTYRIGVWLDSNGDGKVDAGDQFGATSATCSASSACKPGASRSRRYRAFVLTSVTKKGGARSVRARGRQQVVRRE